jgi:hypothetical protein
MKRTRRAGDWFKAVIALAVTIAWLVAGIVLLVHGISMHNGGAIAGGAFLTAIGAIAPGILLYFAVQKTARSAIPGLKPPKVTVTIDRTEFAPGDTVSGRVDIVEEGHLRELDIALVCHDSTSDYQGVSFTTARSRLAEGALAPPESYPFSISIPADAPISYSADGAKIWWLVDARCDVLGTDEHVTAQIEVSRTPAGVAVSNGPA